MKTLFITLAFIIGTLRLAAQGTPISPLIMGQSYHYTHWNSPATNSLAPFSPTAVWPKVTESGTKLVRVGGNQYNISDERPLVGQEMYYVSIVDDIRKNGCEPVLTLPFLLAVKNATTPEPNVGDPSGDYDTAVAISIRTLKKILYYVNTLHKRNVKYVIIGNEPDLDYKWTDDPNAAPCPTCTTPAQQIAENIAGYVNLWPLR